MGKRRKVVQRESSSRACISCPGAQSAQSHSERCVSEASAKTTTTTTTQVNHIQLKSQVKENRKDNAGCGKLLWVGLTTDKKLRFCSPLIVQKLNITIKKRLWKHLNWKKPVNNGLKVLTLECDVFRHITIKLLCKSSRKTLFLVLMSHQSRSKQLPVHFKVTFGSRRLDVFDI